MWLEMKRSKLVFWDVLFGFVKAKKGQKVFDALRRQGKEVREARRKVFEKSIGGKDKC